MTTHQPALPDLTPPRPPPRRRALTDQADTHPCDTCHAPTIAALSDTIPVHLDPRPLTPAGEMAATLAGATTFHLTNRHIIARFSLHIRRRPANTTSVYAPHQCGAHPYDTRPADGVTSPVGRNQTSNRPTTPPY